MKMLNKILLTVACVSLAVSAAAALPTYKTVSAYGNAAAPATAYFPADANSQIRVIGVNYSSDTNIAALNFSTASTKFWQTATNQAATSVTNQINSTNGLSVGATLILEHGGVPYTATVLTWNQSTNTASPYQGTNVVLNGNGWNTAVNAADPIYLMATPTPIPIGANTNVINGDAIYVGNYGRPVQLQFSVCSITDRVYTASAHYDSASQ